jgi:hypothetical protein
MATDKGERTATCACGQLTARVHGQPVDVYACTCLVCQRKSGSAFTYSALFPEASVSICGRQRNWRHHGDSGRWTETQFCPTCGVTVGFRCEGFPGLIGLSIGCFADPDFSVPTKVYWASRRHRWLALPDLIETNETQPG